MASDEHRRLADYIKNVHVNLRINARKHGASKAWKDHCQQKDVLTQYARTMHQLATKHWNSDLEKKINSRIEWIMKKSREYFMDGGKQIEKEKELKIFQNLGNCVVSDSAESQKTSESEELLLLDVGSCYNPFKAFPFFKVLAIDLEPASNDVCEADFLQIPVGVSHVNFNDFGIELKCIPEKFFDIVVFSLLLEYMPSPHQRLLCCEKAYQVLKPEGLLFIISPDSKHATANSSLMKKWRICMAQIGFSRTVYEKLSHIHCMVFRKNINAVVSQHWARRKMCCRADTRGSPCDSTSLTELLKIPQDDTEYNILEKVDQPIRTDEENSSVIDMFQELPQDTAM